MCAVVAQCVSLVEATALEGSADEFIARFHVPPPPLASPISQGIMISSTIFLFFISSEKEEGLEDVEREKQANTGHVKT